MPLINTIITTLVAGLTIGAQAGPCRPHPLSSSVVQSQVATTAYAQPTTETSIAYSGVMGESKTETSLSTTAVQATSSEKTKATTVTTDDETTTIGYPAAETTSVVSDSLSTESAIKSATTAQETTPSPPSMQENSSTLLTTTSALSTTSQAEDVPSITAAPTTTSEPAATTSEASTASCANKSNLACGKTGFLTKSDNKLLDIIYDQDLEECKADCEANDECEAIGITTSGQCELYEADISDMGFEGRDSWYYSVYDACCFEDEQ